MAVLRAHRRGIGSLTGPLIAVGAAATVSRGAALAKDLLVANRFGVSDALDAFLVALAVPLLVTGTVRSAVHGAFVPWLVRRRAAVGPEQARGDAGRALGAVLAFAITIGAVLFVFAGALAELLGSAFAPDKRRLTADLLRMLAPFVALDAVAAIWGAAMHAEERFGVPTLAGALSAIVTGLLLWTVWPTLGVALLALGMVGGAALEAATVGGALARNGRWFPPRLETPDRALRELIVGFGTLIVGTVLMAASPVVDQLMAARLSAGSVAALSFGGKISAGILGIAAVALGTVVLPRFSRLAGEGEWGVLTRLARRIVGSVALAGLAVALGVAAISVPVVRALFEHGSFDTADTAVVARIQALYVLQFPGHLVGLTLASLLNSLGRHRVVLALAASSFTLNVVGNLILMRWIGVAGIALSTTATYTAVAIVTALAARAELRRRRATP